MVSAVLRAMAHLSRKADRHVAQLSLVDSSASSSNSDGEDSEIQSPLRRKDKMSHAHAGKSLKSGKEAEITSTVLYSQSRPHCYLSITHGRCDFKYEELSLAEFVAGYGQILLSTKIYQRWNIPHVSNIWFRQCIFPSFTTGRLC